MRRNSLSLRLAAIAGLGSAIALVIAGLVFITLFRQSVERNFDARLNVLLQTLVGAAITEEGIDTAGTALVGEPRFSLPQSGWYWQIRDTASGEVLADSDSLFGDRLALADFPPASGAVRIAMLKGPAGRGLRGLERRISPPSGPPLAVLVAGDADAMAAEIAQFRFVVFSTLAIFAVILAFGMAGLVRFGLRPLREVRHSLKLVELGEKASLEGEYPEEITPLVNDLNTLLRSNREIVERSRTHVGNLAHALKTPIAVLINEAKGEDRLAVKMREQAVIMRDQIHHHLDRARMAAQTNVIGAVTPVAPVIEGILRVMRKVHEARGITIADDVQTDLRFRGEKQDLEEIVGNLVDNACKWAASRVTIKARSDKALGESRLHLTIEDDGPGLPGDSRQRALRRGARLDESKPGSGLGLSIVFELVELYGGTISLEDAAAGGLSAQIFLPAVDKSDI
ncbi:MAG: ATP-binding protein [Hyphomicrobiales bacterium]|nr:ATP-binding protein [Hyphomicrobiales bacterium]